MGLNRRAFMQTLGIAGATLAVGKSTRAKAAETDQEVEFMGFLFDATRCAGCQACEFACAEAHGLPEPEDWPEVGKVRKTDETCRTVVNLFDTAEGEFFVKDACMHCNDPACVAACLTQAMYKTKEGPVIWRGNKCMGCRYCMVSCPFDVPKFEYFSSNPKILKCDMCFDRIKEGQIPACAEACPEGGIVFGTRRELIAEARKRMYDNPGVYKDHIYGEHEAGGTGLLYIAPVDMDELGFKAGLQNESYPALTKGFLYSVPSVFVLVPSLLLGIQQATKNNKKTEDHGDNT